jgi:hypothetical protein
MMPGLTSPQETSVLCMAGIVCQMTAMAQSPLLGGLSAHRRPRFIIRPRLTQPLAAAISRHGPDLGRPRCSTSCCAATEKHAAKVGAMPARPLVRQPGAEVINELHADSIAAALAHGVIQPPADGLVSLLAQRGGYGSTQYGNDGDGGYADSHQ